jgi:hypothetical protein
VVRLEECGLGARQLCELVGAMRLDACVLAALERGVEDAIAEVSRGGERDDAPQQHPSWQPSEHPSEHLSEQPQAAPQPQPQPRSWSRSSRSPGGGGGGGGGEGPPEGGGRGGVEAAVRAFALGLPAMGSFTYEQQQQQHRTSSHASDLSTVQGRAGGVHRGSGPQGGGHGLRSARGQHSDGSGSDGRPRSPSPGHSGRSSFAALPASPGRHAQLSPRLQSAGQPLRPTPLQGGAARQPGSRPPGTAGGMGGGLDGTSPPGGADLRQSWQYGWLINRPDTGAWRVEALFSCPAGLGHLTRAWSGGLGFRVGLGLGFKP